MSEWASRISLCGNEMSLQSGAKLFKNEDFAIIHHEFKRFQGNIEFRFAGPKPTQFFVEASFLFGITQSIAKSNNCWFLNERLGRQHKYLKCWLETARREDLVSRYRVTNDKVFMVVKRAKSRDEKITHISEPHAQVYLHTKREDGFLSTDSEDWVRCCTANETKMKKGCYKTFDYELRNEF